MENADTDEQRQCVVCLDAPRSHLRAMRPTLCLWPCAEAVLSDGTSNVNVFVAQYADVRVFA